MVKKGGGVAAEGENKKKECGEKMKRGKKNGGKLYYD